MSDGIRQLRVGIIGLGGATTSMLPSLLADQRILITAVADLDRNARDQFAADFDVRAHSSTEDLCTDPHVDAVYVATPHALHAPQALAAVSCNKHVLVEKPLALTVHECQAVQAAAEANGVHVVVGHTHAFDKPVLGMWEILRRGELGRLAMINTWNYSNFLYRPRRRDELDTSRGGGIIFNQVPHQVDVVRLLGGGMVRSVRSAAWALDESRPTEGSHATFLEFIGGAAATLVFSGYDFFDTDEFHDWVGETGEARAGDAHGAARRALRGVRSAEAEEALKRSRSYGSSGSKSPAPPPDRHQPHFGILVVSCERGDIRASPDGFVIYRESGVEEVAFPSAGPFPDKSPVVDELYRAAVLDESPVHDAAWGTATLEVCQAILTSSREGRPVLLEHQVPSDRPSRDLNRTDQYENLIRLDLNRNYG